MKIWRYIALLASGLFSLGLMTAGASAQTTPNGFSPCGSGITLSASSVTSNALLNQCGSVAVIWNIGSQEAFVSYGPQSSQAATTSSMSVPGGAAVVLQVGNGNYLAAITSASTTTLRVSVGNGFPALAGGGTSGGGSGGAVTIADGADVALGAKADAAYAGSGAATLIAIQKGAYSALASLLTAVQSSIPAGTNIIGQVGIDQTTPGTTNAVAPIAQYNTTLPTLTTGNFYNLQLSSVGRLLVGAGASGSATDTFSNTLYFGTGASDTQNATRLVASASFGLNGSTLWERFRTIGGATAGGVGTSAVALAPTNAAPAGVPISSTSALASNQVVCSAACNLYSFEVSADSTLSGTAWWVMIFNATSAPADGAVTPAKCYAVPSGTTSYSAAWPTPVRLGTGATIVTSTTGCFSKTASVHAFISGDAQQ